MQTPTPVARRRAATMGPMQIILDSASQHPPPAIWGAGTGGGGGGGSGSVGDLTHSVTPQLISVNDQTLDLAILCDGNTILATNLVEPDSTDSHHHRSSTRMVLSTPDGACAGRNNGLCRITFATDGGAPRPGDELVPSDSIPPNLVMQGLEFSPSGSSLLVWGEKYVAVARAPRGGGGGSGAGGASGRWRWTLVDMSGYAVDILRQR
ncbi:unnamed protein product, partial [Sphacelaria rigidula]